MKKSGFILLAVFMITICTVSPALAVTHTYNSSGRSFTRDWELTTAGDGQTWLIKYGFNTAFINEDYTHTYHSTKHHVVATVSNDNGSFSDEDSRGRWAGIEVSHNGSSVTYSISY